MAKAKVVHSQDACTIIFNGNKSKPEPTLGVIKFPGGNIEVSRTSNGEYWAHISVTDSANVKDSRVDLSHAEYTRRVKNGENAIPSIPGTGHIEHIAIRISNK